MSTELELKPVALLRSATNELIALMGLNATPDADVAALVSQEIEYFRMHALLKPEIMECVPETILLAFKDVIKKNLSFNPSESLVYIKTRTVEIAGQKRKALDVQESANGMISVYRQCGRILDIKNPLVAKDASGKVVGVCVEILLPSIPAPRWETRTFDESDFMRWRIASHKDNGRYAQNASSETLNFANANYTSWKGGIDPEFARAKAIRHGLKKLGRNQNEGKFTKIMLDAPNAKEVVISEQADNAAAQEEITPHQEISTAIQPNTEFTNQNRGL